MARRETGDDALQQNDQPGRPPVALILGGIVAALAVVFVVQNTGDANVKFLWVDFNSSVWLVIILSVALGIIIDRLFSIWWRRSRTSDD